MLSNTIIRIHVNTIRINTNHCFTVASARLSSLTRQVVEARRQIEAQLHGVEGDPAWQPDNMHHPHHTSV